MRGCGKTFERDLRVSHLWAGLVGFASVVGGDTMSKTNRRCSLFSWKYCAKNATLFGDFIERVA